MGSVRRRLADDAGFSLAELLMVMVLTGIIGTATTSVLTSMMRTERMVGEMRTDLDEARVALDRLRLELREARRVYDTATATSLEFWVDANADAVQTNDERVTYRRVGNQLRRWTATTAANPQVLARNLKPLDLFVYAPDNPLRRSDARTVVITLQVDSGAAASGPLTASTTVRMRNAL